MPLLQLCLGSGWCLRRVLHPSWGFVEFMAAKLDLFFLPLCLVSRLPQPRSRGSVGAASRSAMHPHGPSPCPVLVSAGPKQALWFSALFPGARRSRLERLMAWREGQRTTGDTPGLRRQLETLRAGCPGFKV
uniref:Uncharacterized protein n=1 Tax=Rangifer tarandus platyrhynchus TaxID=3082113 RepID=A0ACB0DXZ7_RANTA|nr:unnamed protein product [Rangifer tarandus platyrhynchus]